ncbi:MAG TPA: T9SS type A sorting domain-containing protein [Ignavibacteriaceae bacterium]|nr:T9SS type A sorting domain-containing protein [Ignavibacteriaceae bacterium]
MKKLVVFFLLLLQSVILPQNIFIRQITTGDFDARNPFIYKDEFSLNAPPMFFELHQDGYSNVYSIKYNSGTGLFEDTVALTFGTDLNINPSFESNSGLLYQTNKNGNWDIALLPYSNNNWGMLKYLTNSLADETDPKFFESTNSFPDSVNVLFKRNDDIVHLSYNQNQISEETVFQNTSQFTYTEFVGLDFYLWAPFDGLYVFAIEQDNSNQKRIVRKFKPTGGEWQEKIIVKDSCDCSGLSLQVSDYMIWGLFYLDSLQGQKRYYMVEDPITVHSIAPLEIEYEGNLSSFEMYSLLIVGKNINKENLDPIFYMPYTYLLENNGVRKVRISLIDFGYWDTDSLVQVSVANPNLAVGPVGLEYNGLVVYTVWEDSIDGHIQLFGIPTHLGYGAVKDESIANDFVLYQNYPNPFNPSTKIEYKLMQASDVKFNVFNILGEKVIEQNFGYQTAGSYKIDFDGKNLPSGVYVYSIYTSENRLSRKMMLMK